MNLSGILSLALMCSVSSLAAAIAPPNIVLIFADDLGYGDVGCYGATKVQTPNIDRLAAEGRRFTDAHSASAVCTPSRYALMTGEYPFRQGVWGPCHPNSKLLIDTDRLTIAKLLKQKGYDTSCFGKWHLGFGEEQNDWKEPLRPGPNALGFDHYYGVPVVNSAPPYVFVENDRIVGMTPDDPLVYLGRNAGKKAMPITPLKPKHGNRVPNWFGGAVESHKLYNDFNLGLTHAEKATQWISERGEDPFFLYLATTQIHHPFTPAPRFQGTSQCGLYGDFIHELDWMVGEVMKALEKKGVADNTLVIFTSDNGGMFNENGQDAFNNYGHQQNGKLLGFKFGAWEGGHRVPFIARWPGRIEAGSISDQLICNIDLLASFAALTEQSLGKKERADSVNVLPALVGDPDTPVREELVLAPARPTHLSLRKGKWMFIDARGSGGFGGTKPGGHGFAGPAAASYIGRKNSDIENGKIKKDAPPAQLYDLDFDPYQTKNLYHEYPEVVQELRARLQEFRGAAAVQAKAKRNRNAAPKISATPSKRSVSFDFESGKLAPWKIVKGEFGNIVGSRSQFFGNQGEYNKQGDYYLTTLESSATARRGMDKQTGVVVSPLFIPEAGKMTFRVGGGSGAKTYVALCTEDGTEVRTARGINDQVMQKVTWDLTPHAGKKMFLKIVDQATGGWGHVTADNFRFDGKLLDEHPAPLKTPSSPKRSASLPAGKTTSHPAAKPHGDETERFNFVIIFTDDQGYGDLGCFGSTNVQTPHIDRMAAEGMKLTSFYVAAPYCTPSRAALMTGCYPQRIGMGGGVLLSADKRGLNPKELTIAEVLKSAGYRTGMFGKWHLGDQPAFLPTRQGFDEFFGLPYSHDIHPHNPKSNRRFPPLPLLEGEEVIELEPDADYLTQRFTERAVKFIEQHKDHPFFLYVPHPIPHRPNHMTAPFMEGISDEIREALAEEKATGKINYEARDKLYFRAVNEIDWSVGQILDALKQQGIDKKTLVLFTSDNGQARPPVGIGSAGPLKGAKGMTWEGGMRMPTVIRCPGLIAPNTESDEILTAMDVLPTFARLAGAKVPNDRVIDGKDIWPVLTEGSASPHEAFFYHRLNSLQAVRSGKWKLHLANGRAKSLYDLETDIGETTDVKAEHPDVVTRLRALVKPFQQDVAQNRRPAGAVQKPKPLTMR